MAIRLQGNDGATFGSTTAETENDIFIGHGGNDTISPRYGDDIVYADGLHIGIPPQYYNYLNEPDTIGFSIDSRLGSTYDYHSTVSTEQITFTNSYGASAGIYYVNPDGTLHFVATIATGTNYVFTIPTGSKYVIRDSATRELVYYIDTDNPLPGWSTGNTFDIQPAYVDGDDIVHGGHGSDRIYGGGGNDSLYGGTGTLNNTSSIDDSTDYIWGEEGNDTIYGHVGDDRLSGGAGIDNIYGGTENDTITGGAGADTVYGGTGDDVIHGDYFDLLDTSVEYQLKAIPDTSLSTNNTYYYQWEDKGPTYGGGTVEYRFTQNEIANANLYYIDPDGSLVLVGSGQTFNVNAPANATFIWADGDTGEIKGYVDNPAVYDPNNISGTTNDLTNYGIEAIYTGGAADTLYGDDGNDTIYGETGNDQIYAGAGNDSVFGGDGDDVVQGGAGNDAITVGRGDNVSGEADRDLFTFNATHTGSTNTMQIYGGTDSTAAGDVDDYDVIDLNNSGLDIVSKTETLDADGNSYSGTLVLTDGTEQFTVDYYEIESIICFVRGTTIETANGPRAVEDLKAGDKIRTYDNGFKPIEWIGSRTLNRADLKNNPKLNPIKISAGALGHGYPKKDLYVSPQHRVFVQSDIAMRMFGTKEILVAAKKLLRLPGIEVATDFDEVHYFHFLFDQHEIVFSNGAATESLFTGPEALATVSPDAKQEILELFPELTHRDYCPNAIRPIPTPKEASRLMQRMAKNHKKPVHSLSAQM